MRQQDIRRDDNTNKQEIETHINVALQDKVEKPLYFVSGRSTLLHTVRGSRPGAVETHNRLP